MIVWSEWPLWMILMWMRVFTGCPDHWTRHPSPRVQRSRRWWP